MIRFHTEHTWARKEGDLVVIGVSNFAQAQLGDVTFADLPQPGTHLKAGAVFGALESEKALNELFAPLSGEVVETNSALSETPFTVNESPYERGWLIKIRPADSSEWDSLLTQADYESQNRL